MNEQKLAGMLGLAVRAGKASAGMDACRFLIRSGKCGVLLLDGETQENTRNKAEDLCRQTGTPVMMLPPGLIERATGKTNRVLAIQEGSFAEQILNLNDGEQIHQAGKAWQDHQ